MSVWLKLALVALIGVVVAVLVTLTTRALGADNSVIGAASGGIAGGVAASLLLRRNHVPRP